jgi:hypothetical protein
MSSITALKSVMLTNFFSHHCLSGIRIGAASDIDPGFGSPRMYPGHSVPTALHPGWTCMLQTLSLCIHLAAGISFFVDFFFQPQSWTNRGENKVLNGAVYNSIS